MTFTRRSFISSSGALLIGMRFHHPLQVVHAENIIENPFDAWVHIPKEGKTEIVSVKSEMGQGVLTSLPMLIAEEAELDWEQVSVVQSDHSIGTGGSGSVRLSYLPYRQAGAVIREAMIQAAVAEWEVMPEECFARQSQVTHRLSGRSFSYKSLVARARQMPLPDPKTVRLKDAKDFTLIGKPTAHLDIPDKVLGKAKFGLDVRLPGMVYGVVAQCPMLSGKLAHFETSKARAVPGVLAVFEISAPTSGGEVAVVAQTTWAAIEGRKALQIEWTPGPSSGESTDTLTASMQKALGAPPLWTWQKGDQHPDGAPAATRIESIYELPFLAHATMEPMNTTVHVKGQMCEVWAPTQSGTRVQSTIAKELGLPLKNVLVHVTLMGGGFGRRFSGEYERQAARVAQRMQVPVQLVWTREDDMTHDLYRPACLHRLRGGLDHESNLVAWSHVIADTSIVGQWSPSKAEQWEVQGAVDLAYPVPLFHIAYCPVASTVPRGAWRSIPNSLNGIAVECFIDELAHAAAQDPYAFRKRLLCSLPATADKQSSTRRPGADEPQPDPILLLRALDLAAEKASWNKPLGKNRGKGIACWRAYETYMAQVTEVTIERDQIHVDRIVTVIDCGQAINPNGVRAQIEGGTLFGLSAVLKEAITVKNGAIEQQNFSQYRLLRMPEAPMLETYLIDSTRNPGGIGEAAVAIVGPSVANAVFAATGERLRKFPLRLSNGKV